MIFSSEYHILIISAIILASIWVISSYISLRNNNAPARWRSILFNLMAYIGLFLLINVPQHREKRSYEPAYISKDKIDLLNSFEDVHSFLNDEAASYCDTLHVMGAYLSKSELELLQGHTIKFHPDTLIKGVSSIHWPKIINENENWITKGDLQGDNIEILLIDPTGVVDKAIIRDSVFTINARGPSPGHYLYELKMVYAGDTSSYQLPIEVKESPQWNLLMLLSYPNPEANYLKNYWIELGHGFSMRTQISKEKYKTSFANTNTQNLNEINRALLKKFKFIYIDIPSWNGLTSSERRAVLNANRNDGLAILWVPTAVGQTAINIKHPNIIRTLEKELTGVSKLKVEQYELGTIWRNHALNSIQLGTYRNYGLGIQYLISTQNSYQLILAGEEKYYRTIWSDILTTSYKNYSNRASIITPHLMWDSNNYQIQILTYEALKTTAILDDTISIELLEEPFIDHSYSFNYLAQEGIHKLHLPDQNESFTFYVNGQSDWPAIQQKQKRKLALIAEASNIKRELDPLYQSEPYPIGYWLALTFIGFGLLWLNERL